jgi:rhodanese-related sulfurtransferase
MHLDRSTLAQQLLLGAVPVDLRDAIPFGKSHIAGSVHIKVKSPNFRDRVLRFTPGHPLLLLADTVADVEWASSELGSSRTIAGYILAGEIEQSGQPMAVLSALEPDELCVRKNKGEAIVVLDVREPEEWKDGCIAGAIRIPMNAVLEELDRLPLSQPIAITCAGGQRSSLIASLLRNRGFQNLFNVTGGMKSWIAKGLPTNAP